MVSKDKKDFDKYLKFLTIKVGSCYFVWSRVWGVSIFSVVDVPFTVGWSSYSTVKMRR